MPYDHAFSRQTTHIITQTKRNLNVSFQKAITSFSVEELIKDQSFETSRLIFSAGQETNFIVEYVW